MKKSDSAKIRELKEKLKFANDSLVRLCAEITEQEEEIEKYQEKTHKLEIIIIEQRGAIGYLEHKLEKKGKEDDTN